MKVMDEHKKSPELRLAQKKLASEFIRDLRGEEELEKCIHISEALFKGNIKELTHNEIEMTVLSLDSFEISEDKNIVDLLVEANICSSKREAREFVNNNSISINGDKVNNLDFIIKKEDALYKEYTIIRKGKKKYFVIKHS